MAVPKRKVSGARRDKRRANNFKLVAPNMVKCPNCGEYNLDHRVCKSCGHYDGKEVVAIDEGKDKKKKD